jgi:hypothetical protein
MHLSLIDYEYTIIEMTRYLEEVRAVDCHDRGTDIEHVLSYLLLRVALLV